MANPNGLNPNFASISFLGSTAIITGGVANTDSTIAAEILPLVGVPANGSVYFSSGAPGGIWVMVSGACTSVTIR